MTDEEKNLTKFAVRTLFIYRRNAKMYGEDYEFTLVSGAVLNVLSAVYDGKKVAEKLRAKLAEGFPFLEPNNMEELINHIQQLHRALSAKTKNYHVEKDEAIVHVKVETKNHTQPVEYGIDHLKHVLACFENAVKSVCEYREIYDEEKNNFDRKYPETANR